MTRKASSNLTPIHLVPPAGKTMTGLIEEQKQAAKALLPELKALGLFSPDFDPFKEKEPK